MRREGALESVEKAEEEECGRREGSEVEAVVLAEVAEDEGQQQEVVGRVEAQVEKQSGAAGVGQVDVAGLEDAEEAERVVREGDFVVRLLASVREGGFPDAVWLTRLRPLVRLREIEPQLRTAQEAVHHMGGDSVVCLMRKTHFVGKGGKLKFENFGRVVIFAFEKKYIAMY